MTDITPAMAWKEILMLLKIGAWFIIPWAVGVFVILAVAFTIFCAVASRFLWGKNHARY